MPRPSRRDHLVQTAIGLFCEHGFHATGIDMILDRAGVSKKTMYEHFRTKDELILAALRQYDSQFRNFFMREVEKAGATPQEKLLAIFDVAHAWFTQTNFFGCTFINAVGEYSEKDSPICAVSREFKTMMRNYIEKLAVEAGAANANELASELSLLLEGAIVTAQVSHDLKAAYTAQKIAGIVLDRYLPVHNSVKK